MPSTSSPNGTSPKPSLPAGIVPYYEHGGITIFCADCRDILPHVTADVVVTDPPWNRGYFADDNKPWPEYAEWLRATIATFPINECVIFQSSTAIPYVAHVFAGWTPIAVCKNFSQMSRSGRVIPNAWDVAFARTAHYAGNSRNWFVADTAGMMSERTVHPTPRSVDAMVYAVSLGDWSTILDPFMGSGTTLVAAKQLGRKAIGIEIEERYCEIAVKRLAQEVLPLEMAEPEMIQGDMIELAR